jgi:hypothetical protein
MISAAMRSQVEESTRMSMLDIMLDIIDRSTVS